MNEFCSTSLGAVIHPRLEDARGDPASCPTCADSRLPAGLPGYASTSAAAQHNRLEGDDPMIVEYIRYKIDPGRTGEFDDAYRRAGALLDASPHCQRWEASRSVDESEKQIVRIEWDSVEGHLQGFRQSADFKPFVEATRPFFTDIEEMTHYQVTAYGESL
jgi:quinol monooxygenase YgiN